MNELGAYVDKVCTSGVVERYVEIESVVNASLACSSGLGKVKLGSEIVYNFVLDLLHPG